MTTNLYLEHANITVNDLDEAVAFFQTAFPTFKIRGGGEHNGRNWIHIGDDHTYLALNSSIQKKEPVHNSIDYLKNGFNHIGFVVDDVDSIAIRLLAAGYQRDYPKQTEKFRIRDYFIDKDGNEYEFVQYLTEDINERNSFE